jgi:DNA-binding MarR family transcriptional regulator
MTMKSSKLTGFSDDLTEGELASNFGQVLLRAARLWNEAAVHRVQAASGPQLRLAHTGLFPHLNVEGRRATEIARRMGVTKQAVGPLLADLEGRGLIERVPDPKDGRARLLRLTPAGVGAMREGLQVLAQVEDVVREQVGGKRLRKTHAVLAEIVDLLEKRP